MARIAAERALEMVQEVDDNAVPFFMSVGGGGIRAGVCVSNQQLLCGPFFVIKG